MGVSYDAGIGYGFAIDSEQINFHALGWDEDLGDIGDYVDDLIREYDCLGWEWAGDSYSGEGQYVVTVNGTYKQSSYGGLVRFSTEPIDYEAERQLREVQDLLNLSADIGWFLLSSIG